MFCIAPVYSQVKHSRIAKHTTIPNHSRVSDQLNDFNFTMAHASVIFTFPKGFKEIPAVNNEDFSFDYAMELPGREFEVWFQVNSQKENYANYLKYKSEKNLQTANPDSLYLEIGKAQAADFSGERNNFFLRDVLPAKLKRTNADAGKSYLLNLLDLPETKHYKYALLIVLQKNHIGTILTVCFTNEIGPEFFKNVDRVSSCLKFKR